MMMGGEIVHIIRKPNSVGVYVAEVKSRGLPKQVKSLFFS